MMTGPERIEYTNPDGTRFERIIDPYGNMTINKLPPLYEPSIPYPTTAEAEVVHHIWNRPPGLDPLEDYEMWKKIKKESEDKFVSITSQKSGSFVHKVYCDDKAELDTDNILKTLARMRGKLMLDIAPIRIESIECSVTPEVKNRLLRASKRQKMYGKKPPLVVRFDEWGERLPDEIRTEDGSGIRLKIVDPKLYGELYFEIRATEMRVASYIDDLDENIPF